MTVRELIRELQRTPLDANVTISERALIIFDTEDGEHSVIVVNKRPNHDA